MFRAERLVKWRTRSISPTSGSGGGAVARAAGGRPGPVGTSHAGSRWQRRPAWLISKRSSVDCGLFMSRGSLIRECRSRAEAERAPLAGFDRDSDDLVQGDEDALVAAGQLERRTVGGQLGRRGVIDPDFAV